MITGQIITYKLLDKVYTISIRNIEQKSYDISNIKEFLSSFILDVCNISCNEKNAPYPSIIEKLLYDNIEILKIYLIVE